MSKDETQILKGLAILMMLWLHLFMNIEIADKCHNLICLGNTPFSNFLSRACNPLDLYLLLGGYGLYCVYLKGEDKRRYVRILKLFIHYWIILTLLIPIIYFFSNKGIVFGSITNVVKNVTSFRVSWDEPCWFLFPYSVLSISYPVLFYFLDRFNVFRTILFVLFLAIIQTNLYFNYTSIIKSHSILYVLNNIVGYLLPFYIGASMKKLLLIEKLKNKYQENKKISYLFSLFFLLLVLLKCLIRTGWYDLYEFLFVLFFLFISRPKWVDRFLWYMGKHSMNIWMIHFMIYFYFEEYIYYVKYPLLIWICLVVSSLLVSYVVDYIAKYVDKVIVIQK
jgi:uncharacterized membrane protein